MDGRPRDLGHEQIGRLKSSVASSNSTVARLERDVDSLGGEIERLQEKIAERLGYRLKDHRLELYGVPIKK